jgi:spore cortex formation protein SpoVR/YcgB (stage V sporulation)
MLEFLHSHTSVVFQPTYEDPRYSGINPYALGYAMMADIKRICIDPTPEDREWFPAFAGNRDPYGTLIEAWAHYRDESFILQFLSPAVIRQFRLFRVHDDAADPAMEVDAIHDESGYRAIRSALAQSYDLSRREPDIQVVDVDMTGDRMLVLRHAVQNGILLDEKTCQSVLREAQELWGYAVRLIESDAATDEPLKTHDVSPRKAAA